jgi:hypothetical protein
LQQAAGAASVSKNVRSLKRTGEGLRRSGGSKNNRGRERAPFPEKQSFVLLCSLFAPERLCAPSERPAARAGDLDRSLAPRDPQHARALRTAEVSVFGIPAPGTPAFHRAPHALFNAVKDTFEITRKSTKNVRFLSQDKKEGGRDKQQSEQPEEISSCVPVYGSAQESRDKAADGPYVKPVPCFQVLAQIVEK